MFKPAMNKIHYHENISVNQKIPDMFATLLRDLFMRICQNYAKKNIQNNQH